MADDSGVHQIVMDQSHRNSIGESVARMQTSHSVHEETTMVDDLFAERRQNPQSRLTISNLQVVRAIDVPIALGIDFYAF